MTKPVIPEPDVDTDRTPEEYANAASRVAQARERVLSDALAKAAHDALMARIEDRLAAKHATLAEVRRAVGLTQNKMAETLGMAQGDVSKLERRNNLHLTTLSRFIEATGGRLRISATYGTTEVDLHIGDLLASDNTTETATTSASSMRAADARRQTNTGTVDA